MVIDDEEAQRAIFLMFALVLCFLIGPVRRVTDYVLAGVGAVSCLYIVVAYEGLIVRMGAPTSADLVLGAAAPEGWRTLALLLAARWTPAALRRAAYRVVRPAVVR